MLLVIIVSASLDLHVGFDMEFALLNIIISVVDQIVR